jgi:glycerophosphoryl diester phosphodiesterase
LVHRRPYLPFDQFAAAGLNIQILRDGFIPKDPSRILVWTVNAVEDIKLCREIGVNVIITDDVALAKSV